MKTSLLSSFLLSTALMASAQAVAVDLSNTPYHVVGTEKGLDPLLLYSVSLAESAFGSSERGKIGPHAWTIRGKKAHYAESKEKAEQTLKQYLDSGFQGVDVGLMQINVRWNGSRVTSPYDLLDPMTNVRVAADVLKEAMASAPGDPVLGIGRYHHWKEEDRARNYGERVLAIYRNLKNLVQGEFR